MGKNRFLNLSKLLSICLCLILCCMCFVACKATDNMSYYDKKVFSYEVQNANLSNGQIVFLGDSITDLFHLDDYFGQLPIATYNRGIGGDTTKGVLKRLKVSSYDIAPSKIVLMIGTNDVNGGRTNDSIIRTYREILNSIKENLPNTQVIVMSVISQHKKLMTYTSIKISKTIPQIIDLNIRIEQLANEFNHVFIDLFSATVDEENKLLENYSDDGIHLNNNGFAIWANLIMPYMENI